MKVSYWKEWGTDTIIRLGDTPDYFDSRTQSWVTDWEYCGICSGDVSAEPITEEEMRRATGLKE